MVRGRRALPPKFSDSVVRLYRSGMSIKDISIVVGYSHNTVSRHLKRAGVLVEKRGRPRIPKTMENTKPEWREAYRLRQKGWTFQQIADHLGVTQQGAWGMVEKIRERMGEK